MALQRHIADDIYGEIVALGRQGASPSEVYQHVEDKFADIDLSIPHEKTVQRFLREEVKPRRSCDTWRLADATPYKTQIVVDAIPTMVQQPRGHATVPLVREALLLMMIKTGASRVGR